MGQRGLTTNFPGIADTILADKSGWRSRLAEQGVFVRAQSINMLGLDLLGNNRDGPQLYSGQRLTAGSSNFATASLALDRFGIADGQITVGAEFLRTSFAPAGPNQFQLAILEYHQRFANGKIEVKAGFNNNISNYVGIFAGGNPIVSTGVGALVPVQVGLSASPATTPSLSITINGSHGFYNKAGIQRSISARGLAYDAHHNGIGLRFAQRDAKALFIEEMGILRPASAADHQLWLRTGFIYNKTRYARFDGKGSQRNWAAYAIADRQILKTHPTEPYRGLYIGASALIAPASINLTTRSLEARIYGIGMIKGRPSDTATLTFGYNRFSADARHAYGKTGAPTARHQWQLSGLYAYRVTRGIYLAPSIAYLRNPAFAPRKQHALNATGALTFLF